MTHTAATFTHDADPPPVLAPASPSVWTDERVEQLKALWSEGLSCSQIAAELGTVSRNAVIGKVTRLGLELRGKGGGYNGNQRSRPVAKPRSANRAFKEKVRHESLELKAMRCAEIVELRISLEELTHENCHWPLGNSAPYTFCGHASLKGFPYCAAHQALATKPTKGVGA